MKIIKAIKDMKYGFWSWTIETNKEIQEIINELRNEK